MNKVYAVKRNADLTEGRGPMNILAFFSNEDLAWEYANTLSGVMGRRPPSNDWRKEKYGDVTVEGSIVHDNLDEFDSKVKYEKAIAKLTEEDIKILGIKSK